jgi:hypothetical protein
MKSQIIGPEKIERSPSPETLPLDLKKGKIIVDSPSYQKMKTHYSELWEPILIIINKLEIFFGDHKLEWALIDGKMIVKLARKIKNYHKNNRNPIAIKIPPIDMAHCIMNQDIIKASMLIPGRKFKGGKGIEIASKTIQSYWRNSKIQRNQKKLRILEKATKIIQCFFNLKKKLKESRRAIAEMKRDRAEEFQFLLKKFVKEWEDIKCLERVEIHINSFAYEVNMQNFI